jgi:hypothetical protein
LLLQPLIALTADWFVAVIAAEMFVGAAGERSLGQSIVKLSDIIADED